jgi:hypothetical protein
MQHDQPTDTPQHKSQVRHPIRTIAHKAAHLRTIAEEGESPATPAILVALVFAFIVPIAALLILLAFGVAHFS